MSNYEIYGFVLCMIVLVALTALFSAFIAYTLKLSVRLIRHGAEDEKIKTEYQKKRKKACFSEILDKVVSVAFCAILVAVCAFATYENIVNGKQVGKIPVPKAVLSSSMEYKNEKNTYLKRNNINNHFSAFDIILLHELPAEEDLKLYDIVVYEKDGDMIVHRIVAIEEPNQFHPNERHFVLQGDAVSKSDPFPVLYSQMRGIYRNQRVPFIGSFVCFMQSPAGYMCVLLMVLAVILTPIMERKIDKEMQKRWAIIQAREEKSPIAEIAVATPIETPVETVVAVEEETQEPVVEISTEEELGRSRVRIARIKRGKLENINVPFGNWTKTKKASEKQNFRLGKLQNDGEEKQANGRVKVFRNNK